jgi:hypothetical protein
MTLSSIWKYLRVNFLLLVFSIVFSIACAISIYSYWLFYYLPPHSLRIVVYFILIGVGISFFYYFLFFLWIIPEFSKLSKVKQIIVLTSSTILGLFLALSTNTSENTHHIRFLLPKESISITASVNMDSVSPDLAINWLKTSYGEIPYDSLSYHGWEENENELFIAGPVQNGITWEGIGGDEILIQYHTSTTNGVLNITCAGETSSIELVSGDDQTSSYTCDFAVPFYASQSMAFILLLFALLPVLLALSISLADSTNHNLLNHSIISPSIPSLENFHGWMQISSNVLCKLLQRRVVQLIIFFTLVCYIVSKSFINQENNVYNLLSFLFLVIGLAAIIYPKNKFGSIGILIIVTILIYFPFYWRLQGFDTDSITVGGIFPRNDSFFYVESAYRILYGVPISVTAAYHPLFTAFLSTLLFVFGKNLILVNLMLPILTIIAIYILSFEIRKVTSSIPTALMILIMVYSYLCYDGKFMTEQVGLPLGILALVFILRGIRIRQFFYIPLALFILALALNVRYGALLVLPLLILWGSFWENGKFSPKYFLILTVATVIPFIINVFVLNVIALPKTIPFANFSYVIYSLSTGKNWLSLQTDFPNATNLERIILSFNLIIQSPGIFLKSIFTAYHDFLNPMEYFSYLNVNIQKRAWIAFPLAFVSLIGLWHVIRNCKRPVEKMLLFALIGIITSVPFSPPSASGIRAMTATMPFISLITVMAFHESAGIEKKSASENRKLDWLIVFSGVFAMIIMSGWLVAWKTIKLEPTKPPSSCVTGEHYVEVQLFTGSFVNVIIDNEQQRSWLPNIRQIDLYLNLPKHPPTYYDINQAFQNLLPGQTAIMGLNIVDKNNIENVWLIVPTNFIQEINRINSFCVIPTGVPPLDRLGLYVDHSVDNIIITP